MKKRGLAAAEKCIALIGAVWEEWPEPARDPVWAYQKLQPVDYRLLHSDALGFVTAKADEGFELHTRYAGATSFEIRCKGVLVMDVENAPSRVLIRVPADARWRAPDIVRLRIGFERWLALHQSQGQLLVESARTSWIEALFERINASVPEEQRCLLGAVGRRVPDFLWPFHQLFPIAARRAPIALNELRCCHRSDLIPARGYPLRVLIEPSTSHSNPTAQ
ncbi:cold-shock protein [Stenotrophomonas sp. YAU14D1_LEIMI4_1]|uniref:cold-shock protein n=1 Tax=Stenotrophomonas sp. YAU14D1_LEIMI4_1 TaxID=2072407 RepID=UPI001F343E33|nr:cold-shock protein [Stenotrophomonas sp. YAU14D1_LEIMI4_1]